MFYMQITGWIVKLFAGSQRYLRIKNSAMNLTRKWRLIKMLCRDPPNWIEFQNDIKCEAVEILKLGTGTFIYTRKLTDITIGDKQFSCNIFYQIFRVSNCGAVNHSQEINLMQHLTGHRWLLVPNFEPDPPTWIEFVNTCEASDLLGISTGVFK
ncbi:MAG: hypothetical protein JWP81_2481 [Ferruginibacter sp.]|nr:hypothetical protein [Ferruginibacter sp.]